jgi:hypothetical protein
MKRLNNAQFAFINNLSEDQKNILRQLPIYREAKDKNEKNK